MSKCPNYRASVLERLLSNQISRKEAAFELGVSLRQLSRLVKRFESDREKGLVHRGKGRIPKNKIPDHLRKQVEEALELKSPEQSLRRFYETLKAQQDKHHAPVSQVSYSFLKRLVRSQAQRQSKEEEQAS